MPEDEEQAGEHYTLRLTKGDELFVFRYRSGDERQVLDELVAMTARPDLRFDWYDAAVLSHQLGRHLALELTGLLPKALGAPGTPTPPPNGP